MIKKINADKVVVNAENFKEIRNNLLAVAKTAFKIEKGFPSLNRKLTEIAENTKNISALIEWEKKYNDFFEMLNLISEKASYSFAMTKDAEVIPELEIEEVSITKDDDGVETLEMCSNVADVSINAPMLDKMLDISLENCTKKQLITMLLSAIAVTFITEANTDDDGYSTNIICSTIKDIYYNYDTCKNPDDSKDECEYDNSIFDENMEDLLLNENVRQAVEQSRHGSDCSDFFESRKKSAVCKKEMEEVIADAENFNKTAVDEIVEELENKIAKAENQISKIQQIIEENEIALNNFRNEISAVEKAETQKISGVRKTSKNLKRKK